jgi:hypothetical protein
LFCFIYVYVYSLTFIFSISLPPSHKYSHTHCTYFTVLSFIINSKSIFKGVSQMYPWCEYTLLWSFQTLPLLSLIPFLPPLVIQQLSMLIVISSTFTDAQHHLLKKLFSPLHTFDDFIEYYLTLYM